MAARPYDAVVVGAGTAGSVCALHLARQGLKVALLDRQFGALTAVGEALAPAAIPVLKECGIYDDFLGQGHVQSDGVASCWAEGALVENDLPSSTLESGWHLDRRKFDALLRQAAADRGAFLVAIDGLAVNGWSRHRWLIELRSDGKPLDIAAPIIIDATGRSSAVARQIGARRESDDLLVALHRTSAIDLRSRASKSTMCSKMTLEATEHGWFYSAAVPGARIVTCLLTDADLLPRECVARRHSSSKSWLVAGIWPTVVTYRPSEWFPCAQAG